MVSKLQLSVLETCLKAQEESASDEVLGRLLEHYYEINEGIGVHKSPELYGAFPTDPYSHTPLGKGAQQPGMTGQVKEDILSRFGELGVKIKEGKLEFQPHLLRRLEFLDKTQVFRFVDLKNNKQQLELEKNSLGFTFCQIPIIYHKSDHNKIEVLFETEDQQVIEGLQLPNSVSSEVFRRSGKVKRIHVSVENSMLK